MQKFLGKAANVLSTSTDTSNNANSKTNQDDPTKKMTARSTSLDSPSYGSASAKKTLQKSSSSIDELPATSLLENPFEEVLQHEHPWTVMDIGLNSISGLLNDPHEQAKRGQQTLKGMDSLPSIPSTSIRKIKPMEFEPYLKNLADVFDRYQYNRVMGLAAATEGTPMLGSLEAEESNSYTNLVELTSRIGTILPETTKPQKEKPHVKRMFSQNAPSIDSVPSIFFHPDFNLNNPHTFAAVCDNIPNNASGGEGNALASNSLLQEKLSHYLDVVEVHLIKEISRRSSSFFAALANLQDLHQETLACVVQINDLRRKLASLSRSGATSALQVVRLKRRKGNVASIYGGIKLMSEITKNQPMIQELVSHGDYVAALDLIEGTTSLLRAGAEAVDNKTLDAVSEMVVENMSPSVKLLRYPSTVPKVMDFRGIKSFANLNAQLSNITNNIGRMMETEFVNILIGELKALSDLVPDLSEVTSSKRDIEALPYADYPAFQWIENIIQSKWIAGSAQQSEKQQVTFPLVDEKLKAKLTPLIIGLLRLDKLGSALTSYKEGLMRLIKNFSKKYYPPSFFALDDNSMSGTPLKSPQSNKNDQQSALARNLKGMKFDAFYDMLTMVYISLLYSIQTVAIINKLIVQILVEAQGQGAVIGTEGVRYLERTGGGQVILGNQRKAAAGLKLDDDEDELGASNEDILNSTMDHRQTNLYDSESNLLQNDTQSTTSFNQMVEESSEIVHSVADLAHMRCSKLVGIRSEQNGQLNPKDFYRLFGATWEFIEGGEILNGRMCFGLKSTMLAQAKGFLNVFHEERTKQLALLVENEQWSQAEVPVDFQTLTECIVRAASSDSPIFANASSGKGSSEAVAQPVSQRPSTVKKTDLLRLGREHGDEEGDLTALTFERPSVTKEVFQQDDRNANSTNSLLIDNQRYFVVVCLLMFMKMMTEYLECTEHIPGLTNDVLNRVLEILKLFNSRICQVILGAGAMRSAGLKNITARHIALAAQTLGAVVAIIPHLKNAMARKLPAKQQVLLTDFDRLLRDFKEHQNELYNKLVSIMNERLIVHSKSMMSINWDMPDQKEFSPDDKVSIYMSTLVKETVTLHKVLSKYLNSETLKKVMGDVFQSYAVKLEEDWKKLDLYSSAGKNRLLMEAQFYIGRLSALDGIDGPGNHLEVVVNNIKIKEKKSFGSSNNPPTLSSMNQNKDYIVKGSVNSFDIDSPSVQNTPNSFNKPSAHPASKPVPVNASAAMPMNLPPPPSAMPPNGIPTHQTSSNTTTSSTRNWFSSRR